MSEESSVPKSYLSFDGVDDYVSLPAMNIDWSQGLTVESWVRFEKFNVFSRIVDFGNGAGQGNIVLAHASATSPLFAQVFASQGSPFLQMAAPLLAGTFTHVAVTVDPAGVGKIYQNGALVQTGPLKPPDSINRTLNYVGKSHWGADGYFHGHLAELRVWKTVRSAADILHTMNGRLVGNEPGLVVYLPLNDGDTPGDSTKARDLGPLGLHGAVHGATFVKAEIPKAAAPAVESASPTAAVATAADIEDLRKHLAELELKLTRLLEQQAGEERAHSLLEQKLDEQLRRSAALQEMLGALAQPRVPQAAAAAVSDSAPPDLATQPSAQSEEHESGTAGKRRRNNILWR